jgi:hypothetical protein
MHHATSLLYHVCAVASSNIRFASCGTSGETYFVDVPRIRADLGEVGWGDEDWICVVHDRKRWRSPVSSVVNVRVA